MLGLNEAVNVCLTHDPKGVLHQTKLVGLQTGGHSMLALGVGRANLLDKVIDAALQTLSLRGRVHGLGVIAVQDKKDIVFNHKGRGITAIVGGLGTVTEVKVGEGLDHVRGHDAGDWAGAASKASIGKTRNGCSHGSPLNGRSVSGKRLELIKPL